MVRVLVSSVVHRGSIPSRIKPDYKIGMCWFSAKHTTLRSMNKDWLVRNQDNVSEWSDMSTLCPSYYTLLIHNRCGTPYPLHENALGSSVECVLGTIATTFKITISSYVVYFSTYA